MERSFVRNKLYPLHSEICSGQGSLAQKSAVRINWIFKMYELIKVTDFLSIPVLKTHWDES
jgi:hypothetical protein